MHRSQRILLSPTEAQKRQFIAACGLSRFSWNWAVALCRRHYLIFGKNSNYKKPSFITIRNHWNKVRDRRFPWVREFSQFIVESSLRRLDAAYRAAFSRLKKGQQPGFPKFHKKGVHESFQVVPSKHHQMRREKSRFLIPRIGMVKCQTKLRWPDAQQVGGRIKYKSGRWWLTLAYEIPNPTPLANDRPACGVDLGCKTFATIASGEKVVEEMLSPKPYAKAKRKLARLHRAVSRRRKGGANRRKAVHRVAVAYERVANIRTNFMHQFTSRLTVRYGIIVLEDLCVKGLAGGMLAGTIHDMGFGEFRRQVEYKAEATGTRVVFADRFYPSSKTCSSCGLVKTKLELRERIWTCECGVIHNRDHNAAINLEKLGTGSTKVTPVESGGSGKRKRPGAAHRNRNTKTGE